MVQSVRNDQIDQAKTGTLHDFRETELPDTINFSRLCIRS